MSEISGVAHTGNAIDAQELRKQLTWRVTRKYLAYGLLFASLAVLPPLLADWSVLDGGLRWIVYVASPLTGVGIVGFGALVFYRLPFVVVVTRACRKMLLEYSFDVFWPQTVRKDAYQESNRRGELSLRMRDAGGGRSPLMRAIDVPRRGRRSGRWPQGIEDGVWVAGDLPFGYLAYVPASGAVLLMHPDKWEKMAPERQQAGPERQARARRAGLSRRIF